jgi:hypothetical protein
MADADVKVDIAAVEAKQKEKKKKRKRPPALMPDGRPKMPNRIKKLYKQILKHPKYPTLSDALHFAFECGCVGGGSWCTKENNAWTRKIWKHLHWGTPLEDEPAPEPEPAAPNYPHPPCTP